MATPHGLTSAESGTRGRSGLKPFVHGRPWWGEPSQRRPPTTGAGRPIGVSASAATAR